MDSSVSLENQICFLRVCHHVPFLLYHSSKQKHQEWKEEKRSGRWRCVTFHVQTCSGRNRIIPLSRRPNTDSTPNKPVTVPRNQLSIRYVVTSPVLTVTIRCYGTRKGYKCVPILMVELILVTFIHCALPSSRSSDANVFRQPEKRLCEKENVRPVALVN